MAFSALFGRGMGTKCRLCRYSWILAPERLLAVLVTHSRISLPVLSVSSVFELNVGIHLKTAHYIWVVYTYFTFLTSCTSCGNIWCFVNLAKSSCTAFSQCVLWHVRVVFNLNFSRSHSLRHSIVWFQASPVSKRFTFPQWKIKSLPINKVRENIKLA